MEKKAFGLRLTRSAFSVIVGGRETQEEAYLVPPASFPAGGSDARAC